MKGLTLAQFLVDEGVEHVLFRPRHVVHQEIS